MTFNLAAAGFGIALAAAIVRSRASRREQWPFAAALVTAAVAIITITLSHTRLPMPFDLLERIENIAGFVVGPLLLLYARQQRQAESLPLHFIPALAAVFVDVPIQLVMLHQFTYTGLSANIVFRGDRASTLWPRRLVTLFVFVHASQLTRLLFHDVAALRNIVPLTLSLGVLALAVAGFGPIVAPSVKYRNAPLPPDADDLVRQLQECMNGERMYLDPALSLQTFAQRAGIPPHRVSQILNQNAGTSFYEYVNQLRVRDACTRLADPEWERRTIDALAEASGFPSRSSFYAAFRKSMGMTPTEYRKARMSSPNGMDKLAESRS